MLDDHGIHPAALTRPQGGFILLVINRLVDRGEAFTLTSSDSASSQSPTAVMETDARRDYAYLYVNLAPGEYHIKLRNHEQLSVTITITP